MPNSEYIKGLEAADKAACRMREEQKDRPNAAMVLGWLHVEICGLIAVARKESAQSAE